MRPVTRAACKTGHTVHVQDQSHGPRATPVTWSVSKTGPWARLVTQAASKSSHMVREWERSHGPRARPATRSMCKISHSLQDLSCRVCTFSPHHMVWLRSPSSYPVLWTLHTGLSRVPGLEHLQPYRPNLQSALSDYSEPNKQLLKWNMPLDTETSRLIFTSCETWERKKAKPKGNAEIQLIWCPLEGCKLRGAC